MTGAWTSQPERGRHFRNTMHATEFKIRRRLRDVFVVLVSEAEIPINQGLLRSDLRIS